MANRKLHIDSFADLYIFELEEKEIGRVPIYTGSKVLESILTPNQKKKFYSDVTNIFYVSDKKINEFKKELKNHKSKS